VTQLTMTLWNPDMCAMVCNCRLYFTDLEVPQNRNKPTVSTSFVLWT